MQYRRSFFDLPKAAQDRDLLWIFAGSAEGAILPIQEESSPKGPEQTSPTNSSDEVEVVEITSSSDTDHAGASSHHQEAISPSNNEDNATFFVQFIISNTN